MAKKSPILGQWLIIRRERTSGVNVRAKAGMFMRFASNGFGEFEFAGFSGFIDYRLVEREDKPAVEWSWQGNEDGEGEEVSGRGWAVLEDNGKLRGRLFVHDLDDLGFVAEKSPRDR